MVIKIKEARKFKQVYLQLTDGELKRTEQLRAAPKGTLKNYY